MRCSGLRSAVLANQMGVSTRTIRRWLDYLEEKGALVRIPVAGKVCAYALDPHEVWKGYNTSKDYSAFVTKTLVNKDGEIKRRIMAMFSGEERSRAVAKRLLTARTTPSERGMVRHSEPSPYKPPFKQ